MLSETVFWPKFWILVPWIFMYLSWTRPICKFTYSCCSSLFINRRYQNVHMGLWLQGGILDNQRTKGSARWTFKVIRFHHLILPNDGLSKAVQLVFLPFDYLITYFHCKFQIICTFSENPGKTAIKIGDYSYGKGHKKLSAIPNPNLGRISWWNYISLKIKVTKSSNVLHHLYIHCPKIPTCSHRPICKLTYHLLLITL